MKRNIFQYGYLLMLEMQHVVSDERIVQ